MADPTGAVEDEAPTCYRHPDRETWVRCNRCERPICPDCMRDAAVGFQCPECVREGNKTMRERRTVFGGRAGADGTVTKVIVGINVLTFLIQLGSQQFTDRFDLVSVDVAAGDYYRLITAAFLHANVLHIAFNMYALMMFGTAVEQALGRARFIGVYLLSAFGGSVLSYLLHAPLIRTGGGIAAFGGLGASGAVFGLFGAYFVIARRLRADTSQIVGLIVVNLLLGFALRDVIDNFAHLGGLMTGAAVTFALAKVPPGPRRTLLQIGAFAGIAVLLVAVAGYRTQDLRDKGCANESGGIVNCRSVAAAPPPR